MGSSNYETRNVIGWQKGFPRICKYRLGDTSRPLHCGNYFTSHSDGMGSPALHTTPDKIWYHTSVLRCKLITTIITTINRRHWIRWYVKLFIGSWKLCQQNNCQLFARLFAVAVVPSLKGIPYNSTWIKMLGKITQPGIAILTYFDIQNISPGEQHLNIYIKHEY